MWCGCHHREVRSNMCELYRKGAEEAVGVQCGAKASSRKRDSTALKLISWHSTIERTSLLRFYQGLFQSIAAGRYRESVCPSRCWGSGFVPSRCRESVCPRQV